MLLTAYTAVFQEALLALMTDPDRAQQLLARAEGVELPAHAALPRAWAVLVRTQLAWNQGKVQRGRVADVLQAAHVFRANDHFDEAVRALALAAHLAAVQGDVALSIRTSIRAFREVRATPECRLLAVRAILWGVPQGEDQAARALLSEIRGLAASAPTSIGKSMAVAYLAYRDFKRILFSAGFPTDNEPYRPAITLSRDDARAAVRRLVAPLDGQMGSLRACLPAEPVPLLFVAAMHGFIDGSAACIAIANEVAQRCGAPVDAYVHATIGAAHLRNGENGPAIHHLQCSWDAFVASDRADEGRPWLFQLSVALRADGRYQEAWVAMDHFLATAPRIGQPWRRTAMVVEALQDDGGQHDEVSSVDERPWLANPRPPYVNAALRWMRANMHALVRVPAIVAVAGVSRRTLEAGFRNYRNRTVAEEMRWIRMHRALKLLREPATRLADVRPQVGYNSASAFSRDFRKVFGVPPSQIGTLVDIDEPWSLHRDEEPAG